MAKPDQNGRKVGRSDPELQRDDSRLSKEVFVACVIAGVSAAIAILASAFCYYAVLSVKDDLQRHESVGHFENPFHDAPRAKGISQGEMKPEILNGTTATPETGSTSRCSSREDTDPLAVGMMGSAMESHNASKHLVSLPARSLCPRELAWLSLAHVQQLRKALNSEYPPTISSTYLVFLWYGYLDSLRHLGTSNTPIPSDLNVPDETVLCSCINQGLNASHFGSTGLLEMNFELDFCQNETSNHTAFEQCASTCSTVNSEVDLNICKEKDEPHCIAHSLDPFIEEEPCAQNFTIEEEISYFEAAPLKLGYRPIPSPVDSFSDDDGDSSSQSDASGEGSTSGQSQGNLNSQGGLHDTRQSYAERRSLAPQARGSRGGARSNGDRNGSQGSQARYSRGREGNGGGEDGSQASQPKDSGGGAGSNGNDERNLGPPSRDSGGGATSRSLNGLDSSDNTSHHNPECLTDGGSRVERGQRSQSSNSRGARKKIRGNAEAIKQSPSCHQPHSSRGSRNPPGPGGFRNDPIHTNRNSLWSNHPSNDDPSPFASAASSSSNNERASGAPRNITKTTCQPQGEEEERLNDDHEVEQGVPVFRSPPDSTTYLRTLLFGKPSVPGSSNYQHIRLQSRSRIQTANDPDTSPDSKIFQDFELRRMKRWDPGRQNPSLPDIEGNHQAVNDWTDFHAGARPSETDTVRSSVEVSAGGGTYHPICDIESGPIRNCLAGNTSFISEIPPNSSRLPMGEHARSESEVVVHPSPPTCDLADNCMDPVGDLATSSSLRVAPPSGNISQEISFHFHGPAMSEYAESECEVIVHPLPPTSDQIGDCMDPVGYHTMDTPHGGSNLTSPIGNSLRLENDTMITSTSGFNVRSDVRERFVRPTENLVSRTFDTGGPRQPRSTNDSARPNRAFVDDAPSVDGIREIPIRPTLPPYLVRVFDGSQQLPARIGSELRHRRSFVDHPDMSRVGRAFYGAPVNDSARIDRVFLHRPGLYTARDDMDRLDRVFSHPPGNYGVSYWSLFRFGQN